MLRRLLSRNRLFQDIRSHETRQIVAPDGTQTTIETRTRTRQTSYGRDLTAMLRNPEHPVMDRVMRAENKIEVRGDNFDSYIKEA
ncbi:MAG: hypothetical protein IKE42_28505 [Aquamicrobium sp.]|nr:hypothetical protein [Aquamicrobium sp.]